MEEAGGSHNLAKVIPILIEIMSESKQHQKSRDGAYCHLFWSGGGEKGNVIWLLVKVLQIVRAANNNYFTAY